MTTATATPPASSAPHAAATPPADRRLARARLQSEVTLAARLLAPMWPLERFIAVNPLGGLEDRPFEAALTAAEDAFGARGTLDEPAFRAEHLRGRITDGDLIAALIQRIGPDAEATLTLGGRQWSLAEVLRCDLLHGAPAPSPVRAARTVAERTSPRLADLVDAQTAKWCSAFLGGDAAGWRLPGRSLGLYGAWRELASADRSLPAAARRVLRDLPERADDALLDALDRLGISPSEHRGYLQAHLTCLPGWAGHVRWRAQHDGSAELVEYLALRVVHESVLLATAGERRSAALPSQAPNAAALQSPAERARTVASVLGTAADASAGELQALADVLERLPVPSRTAVWLDAYEGHYRDRLLSQLEHPRAHGGGPDASPARPAAQLVCCIDTRSEGLRRHLESLGAYETFGFAGFFAVAIRFQDLLGGQPSELCPVLIKPRHEIREEPLAGAERQAARRIAGRRLLSGAEEGFHGAKDDVAGPFALAEASGWVAGPVAAAKTLAAGRYGAIRSHLARRVEPPVPTWLTVQEGFTLDERALMAEVALRMMGLTERFGRIVALCGHGSHTDNNPYGAALECGACGGQSGGPNARTAAAILNGPDVRERLAAQGIDIPGDTWFVAAEHDTASDRIELLDEHLVPASHQAELRAFATAAHAAGELLSAERCATLPGAPKSPTPQEAARHVRARGTDWAQVYPEWGLAGNAAFIVGPRAMTQGVDLGRRAFLHSYAATADPTGTALETILTAPLVVAQWINCQYYFSTVDPEHFGAGTKTIHNAVGGIGVLSGPGGDLRRGLPWQSLSDGDRLVHEPMRLLAIVEAPLERIDAIVERNTVLQHLFGNGWVALAAREHPSDPWLRHTPHGWQPWTTQEVPAR